MSMHLAHLHALERTGGAVWRRYCQLRDACGLPDSPSARQFWEFCRMWQEHPERLKLECERDEAQTVVKEDDDKLKENDDELESGIAAELAAMYH